MTDRNVGGFDAQVDLKAGQPQVAGAGATVDVEPVHPESQVGASRLMLDYTWPTGVQFGDVALLVDYVAPVPLLPLVRWHAPPTGQFEVTGAETPIHWQATGKTFQTALSELPLVVWNSAATRFQLPDSVEDLYYDGTEHLSYAGLEGLTYGG